MENTEKLTPPKPLPLAIKFTPDGEVPVQILENGVEQPLPIPTAKLGELPKQFRPKHHTAMMKIAMGVGIIKQKKRMIPLTRDELIGLGVEKSVIKDLESFGYVKCKIVAMLENRTRKPVGGRAVVYFTPKGHAYMKEKVYAAAEAVQSQGQDQGEGVRDSGPEIQFRGDGGGQADVPGPDHGQV